MPRPDISCRIARADCGKIGILKEHGATGRPLSVYPLFQHAARTEMLETGRLAQLFLTNVKARRFVDGRSR